VCPGTRASMRKPYRKSRQIEPMGTLRFELRSRPSPEGSRSPYDYT
jgi:hypothetical protein